MDEALLRAATTFGIVDGTLALGTYRQPISLHTVPDSFSVPEARKFVAYVFDDEGKSRNTKRMGRLPIIACFRGVTDSQVRRHLGSVEATEVYSAAWGLYAADPSSGRQALYLPHCDNSLRIESALSQAMTWLSRRSLEVQSLAHRRQSILNLSVGSGTPSLIKKKFPSTLGVPNRPRRRTG